MIAPPPSLPLLLPPPKSPSLSLWLPTPDGWSLHLACRLPAERPHAALLLAHGMMLDGRAMDRPPGRGIASFFRRRGYAVYSLDLRGHGESGPRAGRAVDWSFDDLVAVDIPLALGAVKARHPELPLVWLGHSLSAHAGAVAVGRRPELPADLLVLLCPGAWVRCFEPSWPLWQAKRAVLWVWDRITAACGRFPAVRLGIGTDDEARGYVRQHREWARTGRWADRQGTADYRAALAALRRPVLVVAAAADRLCRPRSVALLAEAIGRPAPEAPRGGDGPEALDGAEAPGGQDAPEGGAELWRVTGRDLGRRRHPGHLDVLTDPPAGPLWEEIDRWIRRRLDRPAPAP